MRTILAAAAFSLAAFVVLAVPAQSIQPVALSAAQQASYVQALQAFRERRYAGAFARFSRLADAGHAPSAQIAMLMVQQGEPLFGSDWAATPGQQRRWNALLVNAARGRSDFLDHERGD
ncbi:MAG: hypothetical protein KF788_13200 [Piscinibacter sp.]|nr:hypothetical protein [Piscinibacter sp.]